VRSRTDRPFLRSPTPREQEAIRLIRERPGITVEQLADSMGIGMKRAWQYIARLELQGVRREGAAPARRGPQRQP
jgi:hypothetical protein